MKWIQIPLGPLQTNCYILYNENKDCLIFDPGSQGPELITYIQKEGFNPMGIFLTHAHFDHIGAVSDVRNEWNIPVYIHEVEGDWLTDDTLNGSKRFGTSIIAKAADHLIKHEGDLTIGPFSLKLYHTPGHSPGSISYYVEKSNIIIAGDTLFYSSIGRTDLQGGSHRQLLSSIRNKLLTLPDETEVLPGHGPVTTIQREKSENPFLMD